MKILILPNLQDAVDATANILAEAIADHPRANLGLATGGTMIEVYDALIKLTKSRALSFAGVSTFNLDEYVGIAPQHPSSYHTYMDNCLFSNIDIAHENTHLPVGNTANSHSEAERFEDLIAQSGGIDLQLLGIGGNGHIGFNEPSSSLASRTRVKTLTRETLQANQEYFEGELVPTLAITMGIQTILESKECLLLATGQRKADAVAKLIEGPVSASCPASALQFHPKTTVVIDSDAASQLKNREYYQFIHPAGLGDG